MLSPMLLDSRTNEAYRDLLPDTKTKPLVEDSESYVCPWIWVQNTAPNSYVCGRGSWGIYLDTHLLSSTRA